MTQSNIETKSNSQPPAKSNSQVWYRPTFSPEHGIYVMLFVSFVTGAALAQAWNFSTTLALICAFFGFQAEHPLVLQLKQRRSLKPRFLVWGSLYAAISVAIAFWLYLSYSVLLWLYVGAIAALAIDTISVFRRKQKSIINELITFAAVCLSAPLAYAATMGTISATAMGLWILNTLYFSNTIFTVKLRKPKTSSLVPGIIYQAIAIGTVATLYWLNYLPLIAALAWGIALLKFALVAWQKQWYSTIKIQYVAMLESVTAFSFLLIVALSVLPAHLTTI